MNQKVKKIYNLNKNYQVFFVSKCYYLSLVLHMRSKLQKKPSSNKREHSALQNIKLLHFFYFWVIFALLDLDPDLLDKNQCCATKAIFYCPSMNSHRPRSQNISKEEL
jgi:hypothetical protein